MKQHGNQYLSLFPDTWLVGYLTVTRDTTPHISYSYETITQLRIMSLGVVKSQRHHLDQHSKHKRHQKTCCWRKLLGMWMVTTEPGKSEARKRRDCEAPAAAMGKRPPRHPLSILNLSRAQQCFPVAKSLWCCIQTRPWGHRYFLLLPMARFTGSTPSVFFSTLN